MNEILTFLSLLAIFTFVSIIMDTFRIHQQSTYYHGFQPIVGRTYANIIFLRALIGCIFIILLIFDSEYLVRLLQVERKIQNRLLLIIFNGIFIGIFYNALVETILLRKFSTSDRSITILDIIERNWEFIFQNLHHYSFYEFTSTIYEKAQKNKIVTCLTRFWNSGPMSQRIGVLTRKINQINPAEWLLTDVESLFRITNRNYSKFLSNFDENRLMYFERQAFKSLKIQLNSCL